MRRQVWHELDRVFVRGDNLLELNCGTGLDAMHLSQRGIRVTACDISHAMIDQARQSARSLIGAPTPDFRVLPTEQLHTLKDVDWFDGAFSNFSGLNCVADLHSVSRELARLLKPGASLLVCMLGKLVPWEVAWFLAHGSPETAVRRFRRTAPFKDDADTLKVHYYSRGQIVSAFGMKFRLQRYRGIGFFLPPTYMDSRLAVSDSDNGSRPKPTPLSEVSAISQCCWVHAAALSAHNQLVKHDGPHVHN